MLSRGQAAQLPESQGCQVFSESVLFDVGHNINGGSTEHPFPLLCSHLAFAAVRYGKEIRQERQNYASWYG